MIGRSSNKPSEIKDLERLHTRRITDRERYIYSQEVLNLNGTIVRASRTTKAYSSTASSLAELVDAVANYTTVHVTKDIYLNHTVHVSNVVDLIIISSGDVGLDGHFRVQLFNVSGSSIGFRNITFVNGYAEKVIYVWMTIITKARLDF